MLSMVFLIVYGCRKAPVYDERLVQIYEMSEKKPKDAFDLLNVVDRDSLSEKDQYMYDFLKTKLNDKTDVRATGDDIIKSLLSYYESHDRTMYPEVLYYAGRTYSDLGDYPRAQEFFLKTIAALPVDSSNQHLRCKVFSQLGRLLNRFRLYEEAIPYLKESVDITRLEQDTINMIYDLQLLGRILMDAGYDDEAKRNFNEALSLSSTIGEASVARSRMYLASLAFKGNDLLSARQFIKDTPEKVSPLTKNHAMALAAEIYYNSGNLDSAYYYAKRLIICPEEAYQRNGYSILLRSDLRSYISIDSLPDVAMAYGQNIHKHFDENQKELILLQQSNYNYSIARREEEKATMKSKMLETRLLTAIVVIMILVIAILIIIIHNNHQKTRLLRTLSYLRQLSPKDKKIESTENPTPIIELSTIDQLQEKIRKELDSLAASQESDAKLSVDPRILQSKSYLELKGLANEEMCIPSSKTLIKDLEEIVHEASPSFRSNLETFTEGKITKVEYETALLMKCGFGTKDISVLSGRSMGAISQRKDSLAKKMVGIAADKKTLQNVINLL